jgi:FHS family L-fucose permease-like MFS transporter
MFTLLILLNGGDAETLQRFWPLAPWTALNMAILLLAGPRPARSMALFAAMAVVLLLGGILGSGAWALWCLLAIGLFNSILWSNIFTLSIRGLGESTAQGSSLLVMMIVGGALIPPIQGAIIDQVGVQKYTTMGFHISFLLPMACYAYLVWYGLRGSTQSVSA